jgi:hypothetical protein
MPRTSFTSAWYVQLCESIGTRSTFRSRMTSTGICDVVFTRAPEIRVSHNGEWNSTGRSAVICNGVRAPRSQSPSQADLHERPNDPSLPCPEKALTPRDDAMWSRKRESSLRATISAALPRGARMMGNWPARACVPTREVEGRRARIRSRRKGRVRIGATRRLSMCRRDLDCGGLLARRKGANRGTHPW